MYQGHSEPVYSAPYSSSGDFLLSYHQIQQYNYGARIVMTHDDLFNINAGIVRTLIEAVADNCPAAFIRPFFGFLCLSNIFLESVLNCVNLEVKTYFWTSQ
ncbi:putative malate dehydrogenase [Helianthus debilis subsp. tardiflorus]